MLFYNEQIFKRCFHYRKKYWYKNIKYIPLYFRLLNDLVKRGYDEYATWETCSWFIDTMKPILKEYNSIRNGAPTVLENYFELQKLGVDVVEENEKAWNDIINRMIKLLDLMDESNPRYLDMDWKQEEKERNAAKDEFFQLFSKHFYALWD